jgi:DNA-binding MarR family transcriptional regulator
MTQEDLGIVDALAQLSFLVQGTLGRHAGAHDLSMIQTRLLGGLRDREPTMNELARLLDLDKSSVTGLVSRAEQRGFVQRTPSTEDRRAIHVRLTPAGRRFVRNVEAAFEADITAATACLTPAQRTQLSTLATKVVSQHRTE